MMASDQINRPLQDLALGISISESEGVRGKGFTTREVNRSAREISLAVLAQGGRVAFGHDWRDDGVMSEILQMAIAYKLAARKSEGSAAPMMNFVPAPRRTTMSPQDRERYRNVLEVVETEPAVPPGVASDGDAELLRDAESLTIMREVLTKRIDARLCLGGRTTGSSGRCAGIVEEAALSLREDQALFVSHLFGGASSQVIDAIMGADDADLKAFRPRDDIAAAMTRYEQPGADGYPLRGIFVQAGLGGLSQRNHLSEEENLKLIGARSLSEVIGLTLTGLGRLARSRRG